MFEFLTQQGIRPGLTQALTLGALVIARLGPMVQMVPFLGGQKIPQQVKMGITLALAVIVVPAIWSPDVVATLPTHALPVAALIVKELAIGITLGFIASLTFESARMAGQLVDTARGQTQVTAFVPQLAARASASGDILYQFTVVIFIAVGGHRLMLATLVESFASVPAHQFPALGDTTYELAIYIARLSADAITLGVLLALPVIAAILLADLTLALMNKAAPQMNVFFLGMPAKALLGLAVLLLSLDIIVGRLIDDGMLRVRQIARVLETLGGG